MKITGLCDSCACSEEFLGISVCVAESEMAWVETEDGKFMHFYAAVLEDYENCEVVDCDDYEEKGA